MIKTVTGKNLDLYDHDLRTLEATIVYPFGADSFHIDHGPRYQEFFERLGEPVFNLAFEGTDLVGAAAGILRKIPVADSWMKAWYLCDLKVRADHRGNDLSKRMFRKNLWRHYFRCPRGYAVSMNPAMGENKVVALLRKLPFVSITYCGRLNIWSFDFTQIRKIEAGLKKLLGDIGYLSLKGTKDLRMTSTGLPLPLVHVQHGKLARPGDRTPTPGSIHMICAPEGSALNAFLLEHAAPSASASLVSHQMNAINWGFVLTSEI